MTVLPVTRKQPLATPCEVSEALGIPEKTLANWRCQGNGPKYLKLGGKHVRYDWADVNAWLDGQRQEAG